MIFDNAGSATVAAKAFTGIHALVVPAGLADGATLVLEADGDLGLAALGAHADGLVLQDLAALASLAVLVAAGILALAVETALTGGAVCVDVAGVVPVVGAGADEYAGGVDDHLLSADALGLVLGRLALLVRLAAGRGGEGAGVGTDATVADLVETALLVPAALPADDSGRDVAAVLGAAGDGGVACVALGAVTADLVVDDGAESVPAAGATQGAGILADAADAGLVVRTVRIGVATIV